MIRWKKCCSIAVLTLALALSGCSSSKATVEEVMEDIKTTKNGELEDAVLEFDDVILQVGESKVTYREVLFYMYQAKSSYENKLNKEIWDVVLKGGNSFEEYAKEEILRELTEVKVICEQAAKGEVTLSDAETAKAENEAAAFLQERTEEEKEHFGFKENCLNQIFMENALAHKMYENTVGQADITLDEEEYRQVTVQYIKVKAEADNKEKAQARAEKLLVKAKKQENFAEFAKKKTDADEITATFGKEDMPADIGETSMKLKTGEFSEVIEGTDGYYIVYCVTDQEEQLTADKMAEAKAERESEAFESAYTEWSKDYAVEVSVNLWKAISIKEL